MEQPTVSNEIAEHLAAQMDQRKQAEAAAAAAEIKRPDEKIAAVAAELESNPDEPKTAVFDQRSAVVKHGKRQERTLFMKQNGLGLAVLVAALVVLLGSVALLILALNK